MVAEELVAGTQANSIIAGRVFFDFFFDVSYVVAGRFGLNVTAGVVEASDVIANLYPAPFYYYQGREIALVWTVVVLRGRGIAEKL